MTDAEADKTGIRLYSYLVCASLLTCCVILRLLMRVCTSANQGAAEDRASLVALDRELEDLSRKDMRQAALQVVTKSFDDTCDTDSGK